MGRLGALLEVSWAILKRRRADRTGKPKSFQNLRKMNNFGLSGPSWRTSWRPLGPSWAVVEAFWAVFETSWANLEVSWTLLGRLGGRLGPSWAVLKAILAVLEAILAFLDTSWKPSWAVLEACWAVWERSWRPLGRSWGALGGLLGCLGASESRKDEKAKILPEPS